MFRATFAVLLLALTVALGTAQADPMRPDPLPTSGPTSAAAQVSSITLDSVYLLDNQAYAVINGQWLSVGDRLADVQVLHIAADQVVIRQDGQQRILTPSQSGSLLISLTDED